jgi:hypothetical protein
MRTRPLLRRLRCEQHGATAIEFAVVSGVFFLLLFGIIEFGLIMMTQVAVESATQQVSRSSGIGATAAGCADRACSVRAAITQKTLGLINPESVSVSASVVGSATTATPPIPDICLDNPATPYPVTCIKWEENSGNPDEYNPPGALDNAALGGSGALVEIRVTYLWRVLFPVFRSAFGDNGVLTISSATVIKNEPQ